MIDQTKAQKALESEWADNPRWRGVQRDYSAADVLRLRGSVHIEHSLAQLAAEKLWRRLNTDDFLPTLGALTGGQAVQQVKAGAKAIYLSGWQVAADANIADAMYPDSLFTRSIRCRRWFAESKRVQACRRNSACVRKRRHRLLCADCG